MTPASPPPAAGSPTVRSGRIVRNADARMQPLYPATRLLKGAVLNADRVVAEASELRETTIREAALIRQAALDEATAVRKAAFERGAEEAAAEFTGMLAKLEAEIERMKSRFAVDVQRVAFRFAKAILNVEFQAKPERLLQLVEQVIKPARLYHHIKIFLHPDDIDLVRADHKRIARQMVFAKEIQFCADPKLPAHGVRVETEMGNYDGTLDTQIRRLQAHLLPGEPVLEDSPPATAEPERP